MILIDPPNVEGHGRMWSHLASDVSFDELHDFARALGIPDRGFDRDHYDVPAEWYDQVVALGAEFVEMHAGLDEQAEEDFTFETLLRDGEASGVPFSVAGGVSTATIESVQRAGAVVAVAGGAIYGAPDVGAAAAALRAAIA